MYIEEIEDFISNEESDSLIASVKDSSNRLTTVSGNHEARVAYGQWVDDSDELSKKIKQKLSDLLNVPVENMERLHLVKYSVGGEYKPHHDGFHKNTNYYEKEIAKGGQRIYTALIYLNEGFKGGETAFPNLEINVEPKKNKLIAWSGVKKNGEIDSDSLHAGLPVIEGVKYIAVIWIRENAIFKK